MYSNQGYKICVSSDTLGELESFRIYEGFSIIPPKIFDAIERISKERIFLIPLSITVLNPKNEGFLFFYEKKKPNLGSKMWKI